MEHIIITPPTPGPPEPESKRSYRARPKIRDPKPEDPAAKQVDAILKTAERASKAWMTWTAAVTTSVVLLIFSLIIRMSLPTTEQLRPLGLAAFPFALGGMILWMIGLTAATFGLFAAISSLTVWRKQGSRAVGVILVLAGVAMIGSFLFPLLLAGK